MSKSNPLLRGRIMRLFTSNQHRAILKEHRCNVAAAEVYTELAGRPVSRQLVRYWRDIFTEHEGVKARADDALKEMREFIKPSPEDDIGKQDRKSVV